MKKVTTEDVLNWHGSEHSIDELAEIIRDIINGDYTIDNIRKDVRDYIEE